MPGGQQKCVFYRSKENTILGICSSTFPEQKHTEFSMQILLEKSTSNSKF